MNFLAASPAETPVSPPEAPFLIHRPAEQAVPFVFSSPHSGRVYPDDLLRLTRLDPLTLRRSEDCFIDELFAAVPSLGAPLLLAQYARAYCDVNRDPAELDPDIFSEAPPPTPHTRSPRVTAGLGVIARIIRDGVDIYPARLPLAEASRRLSFLHAPYHDALKSLIDATRLRFGSCVLIDCHSMPSQAAAASTRGRAPDIVLGDRYGSSCSASLTALAEHTLTRLGFHVARNNPYAGGHTVERYGAPRLGIHALQVEINRAAYLNEDSLEKLPAYFAAMQNKLAAFLSQLLAWRP